MINQETKERIELLIDQAMNTDISKQSCIELNRIRAKIDGYFYEGCFCSLTERYNFINNYISWFNKNK